MSFLFCFYLQINLRFSFFIVYYLLLLYIYTGTLLKMIHNSGGSHQLSWRLILQIMEDAAEAMTFLHSVDIIHRDLKAENLLLDEDFRCKLADFGLARTIDKGGTMTICGTPSWIAPEVFEGSHYDNTVDVYSFRYVKKQCGIVGFCNMTTFY